MYTEGVPDASEENMVIPLQGNSMFNMMVYSISIVWGSISIILTVKDKNAGDYLVIMQCWEFFQHMRKNCID